MRILGGLRARVGCSESTCMGREQQTAGNCDDSQAATLAAPSGVIFQQLVKWKMRQRHLLCPPLLLTISGSNLRVIIKKKSFLRNLLMCEIRLLDEQSRPCWRPMLMNPQWICSSVGTFQALHRSMIMLSQFWCSLCGRAPSSLNWKWWSPMLWLQCVAGKGTCHASRSSSVWMLTARRSDMINLIAHWGGREKTSGKAALQSLQETAISS